jgi:short-subunit dehydrogenase
MRQLFETNFWGTVHGCKIAAKHLRAKGGAIINVGSLTSDRAFPVQGIYSASKHAVKGFTDALRTELAHEGAPISVTLVKPASIGTPMPQHVRDLHDREAKFPPPVYAPEEVAKTILHAAEYPVRDAFVGGGARMMSLLEGVAPKLLDWLGAKFLVPAQFGDKEATVTDNLYHGQAEAKVRGGRGANSSAPAQSSTEAEVEAHPS